MLSDNETKMKTKVDPVTGEGLIIERSDIIEKQRFSNLSFKFYSWVCWLYLIRSVVVLILWYLGIKISYFQMINMKGWNNFEFFLFGMLMLSGIFLFMLYWNRYNFIRFSGPDRRSSLGRSDSHSIARYFATKTVTIDQLKNSDKVEVDVKENDTVELVRDGSGVKVVALYAPQNLDLHFKGIRCKPVKR